MNEILRRQLLYYLSIYLRKKLNMEMILVNIFDRLKGGNSITEKQFKSIIKFIEREDDFRHMNRYEIRNYFDPIISNQIISKRKEQNESSTLCQFMS